MHPSWPDSDVTEGRGKIVVASLVILAAGVILTGLIIGRAFLAPTSLAVLMAVALNPVQGRLKRAGLPSPLSAALILLTVLGGIAAAAYAVVPSYETWRVKGPELVRDIGQVVSEVGEAVSDTVEDVAEASGVEAPQATENETPDVASPVDDAARAAVSFLIGAPGVAASILYMAMLTFFLLSEGRRVFRWLIALSGRSLAQRLRIARAMRRLNGDIGQYFLLLSLINAGLGITVTIVFYFLGMPGAPLWGAAMALLNFVPYLGAAVVNVVVFAVAFLTFGDLGAALVPTLSLLALNIIEGQVLTPMLVGQRFTRSALVVFLAVAFGAWLWGATGALLATPILIVANGIIVQLRSAPPAAGHQKRAMPEASPSRP